MRAVLCGIFICFFSTRMVAAQSAKSLKNVIVSVKHPVDSLGEPVYEYQGADEKDVPVVPGVLSSPVPLNQPKPKYSKLLKAEKFEGTAKIIAIISAQGKVVDLETNPSDNPEAARCALEAVRKYRFKAPLLDGKPVAERFGVVVTFALGRP